MTQHRVVFTPSGKRGDFADDVTVLAAARALGVDLDSVCGGRGICGRCQIDVAEGHFAKHGLEFERGSRKSLERGRAAIRRQARRASRRPAPRLPDENPAAISQSTCRPKARSIARSCASAPKSTPSPSIPSCASTMSKSASRTCTIPPAISAVSPRGSRSNGD